MMKLFVLACVLVSVIAQKTPVFVDIDVNSDDTLALIYLLKHPNVDVKAVTIAGNAWAHTGVATQNVFAILNWFNRNDIAVAPGASYAWWETKVTSDKGCKYQKAVPEDDGGRAWADTFYGLANEFLPRTPVSRSYQPKMKPAITLLYEMLTAATSPVTFFCSGTMTNLADVLSKYPTLKSKIAKVVVMGGAVYTAGNLFTIPSNPYAEFNIYNDPDAAAYLFSLGLNIVLVPLDATNLVPMNDAFYQRITAVTPQNTPEGIFVGRFLNIVKQTWFDPSVFYSSYYVWDPTAAVLLANPDYITNLTTVNIMVYTNGTVPNQDGRTAPDPRGKPINVVFGLKTQNVLDSLYNTWNAPAGAVVLPKASGAFTNMVISTAAVVLGLVFSVLF